MRASILSPSAVLLAMLVAAAPRAQAAPAAEASGIQTLVEAENLSGGLYVLVGCDDAQAAEALAREGRRLVQVLEADVAALDRARKHLHQANAYGLASVDILSEDGWLPYAEDLVNVLIVGKAAGRVKLAEAVRVLAPGGTLLAVATAIDPAAMKAAGLEDVRPARPSGASWRQARKGWPKGTDRWTHPRHAADGNPVSLDTLAGPPRRIRWLAGPPQEICNMVTAGGRAYYGGVLARDAFNGLRLWERPLNPTPARGGWYFQTVGGSVVPLATDEGVLVMTDGRLRLLDAATGRELRVYGQGSPPFTPSDVLLAGRTIVAADEQAVVAMDLRTGQVNWRHEAASLRCMAADGGRLFVIHNDKAGEGPWLTCRCMESGETLWRRGQDDLPWLGKVRRFAQYEAWLACEISTITETKTGNSVQVLSADDGRHLWGREFIPHSSHFRQARAMFAGGLLWVLDEAVKGCVGLDPPTGQVKQTWPIDRSHCFPPVATSRYMIAGEMDWVSLADGMKEVSHITKPACSRDAGVVIANGLVYTFPKRCICWPMLRDYAALAPAGGQDVPAAGEQKFQFERGPGKPPEKAVSEDVSNDWPCYRHDAFRSAGTRAALPRELKVLWTTQFGGWPDGPIARDWRENYFSRSPVGPPVAAGGLVYVARPSAHEVVAMDAASGAVRWRFTANGPVDTAPTIHRGLCLFGCKSGWVYALRADDGLLVWRLRAAPLERRIVAYGQIESPWPVPGSVLVDGGTAYVAAGRQPFADGGVVVLAIDPLQGTVRWTTRLDSLPQKDFYHSSGMDFENFDLLHREGDAVAMSRWMFDRRTGQMTCDEQSGYARIRTGRSGGVLVPRGAWSYAPLYEPQTWHERPFVRPLAAYRDSTLLGCTQDRRTVYRRDFSDAEITPPPPPASAPARGAKADAGERFDTNWVGYGVFNAKYGRLWRSQLLMRKAAWKAVPFPLSEGVQSINAMLLAGDALYVATDKGNLAVLDVQTGQTLGRVAIPPPAWDSLAAAGGRLFLTTRDGRVVCLGKTN